MLAMTSWLCWSLSLLLGLAASNPTSFDHANKLNKGLSAPSASVEQCSRLPNGTFLSIAKLTQLGALPSNGLDCSTAKCTRLVMLKLDGGEILKIRLGQTGSAWKYPPQGPPYRVISRGREQVWRVGNARGETPIVVTDRDGAEVRERDALSEAEMLYASLGGKLSGGNATKRVLTTFSSKREVVLYHRIAKTASTTLVNLIEQLSQTNGFYVLELQNLLQDTELWRLTPALAVPKDRYSDVSYQDTAEAIAKFIRKHVLQLPPGSRVLVHGYITYDVARRLALNRFGISLKHISIVREPLPRMVSHFGHMQRSYDIRRNPRENPQFDGKLVGPNPHVLAAASELNLVQCAAHAGCKIRLAHHCRAQLDAICGRDAATCLQGGPITATWLKSKYTYIGLFEKIEQSLAELEARLPRFFDGVVQMYTHTKQRRQNVSPVDKYHQRIENMPVDVKAMLEGTCLGETILYGQVSQTFGLL